MTREPLSQSELIEDGGDLLSWSQIFAPLSEILCRCSFTTGQSMKMAVIWILTGELLLIVQ